MNIGDRFEIEVVLKEGSIDSVVHIFRGDSCLSKKYVFDYLVNWTGSDISAFQETFVRAIAQNNLLMKELSMDMDFQEKKLEEVKNV